jgi:hypothetical protein
VDDIKSDECVCNLISFQACSNIFFCPAVCIPQPAPDRYGFRVTYLARSICEELSLFVDSDLISFFWYHLCFLRFCVNTSVRHVALWCYGIPKAPSGNCRYRSLAAFMLSAHKLISSWLCLYRTPVACPPPQANLYRYKSGVQRG